MHEWNSDTEIIKTGPVFLDKQLAIDYMDKQVNVWSFSFIMADLEYTQNDQTLNYSKL